MLGHGEHGPGVGDRGREAESLPKISEALSQGKLSFDQVKPLVQVAKPDTDARLAEEATKWSAKQVRELAVGRQSADRRAMPPVIYARRFLRFDDRRRSFSGCLPEDHYARVKGASPLERDAAPRTARPSSNGWPTPWWKCAAPAEAGRRPVETDDRRRPRRPGVSRAGGDGAAELDVLGPLSPEVARRLACDAKIILSADNEKGHSIQQGTASRNPTSAQRIEIRRRDKGCRFPGCTYTEFTDVHHVVHWLNGGPTAIPNLVTLCDQHHRAVHELGWKMSGDANVSLSFRSPTGRVTTSTPSPTFHADRVRDRLRLSRSGVRRTRQQLNSRRPSG